MKIDDLLPLIRQIEQQGLPGIDAWTMEIVGEGLRITLWRDVSGAMMHASLALPWEVLETHQPSPSKLVEATLHKLQEELLEHLD